MNSDSKIPVKTSSSRQWLSHFFNSLGRRIRNLFEPEEVEVTFKVDGKKITYTYTKVEHKQVA